MARATLVLGLAVLLIVSTLAVLGSGGAQAQPAPAHVPVQAPHHDATTLQLIVTNANEAPYNDTYFTAGANQAYGDNLLYFAVYDPTADTKVNFTITDPNASRDGIGNPAFSTTVAPSNTTFWYYSWDTGVGYTFPATLAIGGGWTVSASGALGGTVSFNITVSTFYSDVSSNPRLNSEVLPGESIQSNWQTFSFGTGGVDTHLTNVSVVGWYYGGPTNTYQSLFAGGAVKQSTAGFGSYTWTVPANATVDTRIYVALWLAIYVGGAMAENESYYYMEYEVGAVDISYIDQASGYNGICPDGWDGYYDSGQVVQVCAEIGAESEDGFSAVPNLPVTIHLWNGAQVISSSGGSPTSLTTNATGYIAFTFVANSPPFTNYYLYPYYNTINMTASDPAATSTSSTWNDTDESAFYVFPSAASGAVSVQLNQLEYYPGQTITATWTVSSSNSTQTGAISAVAWAAFVADTNTVLAQGVISSTGSTGTFNVGLPTGYLGEFSVDVLAANATTQFYGSAFAYQTAPQLFLNPSSTTFTPGSSVTVTAVAYGDSGSSGATITYQVWAVYELGYSEGEEGLVASGTVANNSQITISVPSTGAPGSYYVEGYLGVPGGSALASAYVELDQSWGYYVSVGVNTPSSYSDGSYQPGQTLTIAYQISSYGNAPLPLFYTFSVYLGGTQIYNLISTPSTSGTFQITIPSAQPSGTVTLELELAGTYLDGNACEGGYCYGETSLVINAHPSALSMEIGSNSGITLGWLILLIVILVVAVILVLLIRRKGTSPPPAATFTGTSATPMSDPAPAPSGSAPPEWKEPPASQPPMPTPPPGST